MIHPSRHDDAIRRPRINGKFSSKTRTCDNAGSPVVEEAEFKPFRGDEDGGHGHPAGKDGSVGPCEDDNFSPAPRGAGLGRGLSSVLCSTPETFESI